jgi:hypothetical protein
MVRGEHIGNKALHYAVSSVFHFFYQFMVLFRNTCNNIQHCSELIVFRNLLALMHSQHVYGILQSCLFVLLHEKYLIT